MKLILGCQRTSSSLTTCGSRETPAPSRRQCKTTIIMYRCHQSILFKKILHGEKTFITFARVIKNIVILNTV